MLWMLVFLPHMSLVLTLQKGQVYPYSFKKIPLRQDWQIDSPQLLHTLATDWPKSLQQIWQTKLMSIISAVQSSSP